MQKFIEIDQAWKILGNEETKKMYDLQRHGRYLWYRDKATDSSWKHSVSVSQHSHQVIAVTAPHPITVFNSVLFLVVIIVSVEKLTSSKV